MSTESAKITFSKSAIREIAETATYVNEEAENIGARRLHTIMSTLLEDVLYKLPDESLTLIKITGEDVKDKLKDIVEDEDLTKYIL